MTAALPIITIDGPAGVGKTTMARMLAQAYGIPYLDSGSLYRYIALKLGPEGLKLPEEQLAKDCAQWKFTLVGVGDASAILCNGNPLGDGLRAESVGALSSKYATLPAIRAALLQAQRDIGASTMLVGDGRDLGTVVFPQAKFKFFLDATPEVRAMRRWRQLQENGKTVDLEQLTKDIRERDEQDRTRAVAPLRPAKDAHIIDTSAMDIPGLMDAMLAWIDSHGGLTN